MRFWPLIYSGRSHHSCSNLAKKQLLLATCLVQQQPYEQETNIPNHLCSFWGQRDMHQILAAYDRGYITEHILAILDVQYATLGHKLCPEICKRPQCYKQSMPSHNSHCYRWMWFRMMMMMGTDRRRHHFQEDLRTFQALGTRLCSRRCSPHHFVLQTAESWKKEELNICLFELKCDIWEEVVAVDH